MAWLQVADDVIKSAINHVGTLINGATQCGLTIDLMVNYSTSSGALVLLLRHACSAKKYEQCVTGRGFGQEDSARSACAARRPTRLLLTWPGRSTDVSSLACNRMLADTWSGLLN